MPDPSFIPTNRFSSFQRQLHISTSSSLEIIPSANWSNLIVPCQLSSNKDPLSYGSSDNKKDPSVTEIERNDGKKKNPYSIEELLKKPVTRNKPISFESLGVHQPYGGLVSTEDLKSTDYNSDSESETEQDIKIEVV